MEIAEEKKLKGASQNTGNIFGWEGKGKRANHKEMTFALPLLQYLFYGFATQYYINS
jgi:hypothetical protein